jgi:hypothetical protein
VATPWCGKLLPWETESGTVYLVTMVPWPVGLIYLNINNKTYLKANIQVTSPRKSPLRAWISYSFLSCPWSLFFVPFSLEAGYVVTTAQNVNTFKLCNSSYFSVSHASGSAWHIVSAQ